MIYRWGVEIPGGGLATPFCSYKALNQPPHYQNGFLRSNKTQKKPYQKEAPTPSKPPTKDNDVQMAHFVDDS